MTGFNFRHSSSGMTSWPHENATKCSVPIFIWSSPVIDCNVMCVPMLCK